MTPLEHAKVFAAMLCCGILLGVLYDLLGAIRRLRGMCAVTDVLFGVFCALGMILTALHLLVDPFRLYAFAGTFCGIMLYGLTAGALIRRIMAMMGAQMEKWEEKCKKRERAAGE